MILILLILITSTLTFFTILNWKPNIEYTMPSAAIYGDIFCCIFYIIEFNAILHTINNVDLANQSLAKVQIMRPLVLERDKLNKAELEFIKVQNTIKDVMDKYQIQAQTYSFKGLKLNSSIMSSSNINLNQGGGDIERGSGDKLKNLNTLIDKEMEIALMILKYNEKVYGDDFYEENKKLHVLKNSIFDGWIVRLFITDVEIVNNKDYFPEGL